MATFLIKNPTEFIKNISTCSGIYTLFNAQGDIIYIGKAKNLKKRVASYFVCHNVSAKQQAMMRQVVDIQVTVTRNESEALLLECQQIKRHKPRYNICLRDDKSFPFIYLSAHTFPQISLQRGTKKKAGQYFGPYPNSQAAKESLVLLQKLFPLRQCEDSVYQNRSRACLQHQIGRCSAPCVGLISTERYATDVAHTVQFLQGQGGDVLQQLITAMDAAASRLQFEQAARYRDQIARLRTVLAQRQEPNALSNTDIIACISLQTTACVTVLMYREGQLLGHNNYFPRLPDVQPESAVMQAFMSQYYLNKPIPTRIVTSHKVDDSVLIVTLLNQQAQHSVTLIEQAQGVWQGNMQLALLNAQQAFARHQASQQQQATRWQNLQQALQYPHNLSKIACIDISHTQGKQTVASFVVFDAQGSVKSAYRRLVINGITESDDPAAIHQTVSRYFTRHTDPLDLPDILFIDGGKAQINAAQKALAELTINNVMIVGVCKGYDRIAGMEKLLLIDQQQPLNLSAHADSLLLVQHIRDEAHRFALTGHQQRRHKASQQSALHSIAGLGVKRRRLLLTQLGGLLGIAQADVATLSSIKGISQSLAQRIYEHFHQHDGNRI